MRFPSATRPSLALTALFVAVVSFTVPQTYSDTGLYASDIWSAQQITDSRLWDFGHLLWRPLGWVAHRATAQWTEPYLGHTYIAAYPALVALGLIAGLVSILLTHRLAEMISGRANVG